MYFFFSVLWTKISAVLGKSLCKLLLAELYITRNVFYFILFWREKTDYIEECSGVEVKGQGKVRDLTAKSDERWINIYNIS